MFICFGSLFLNREGYVVISSSDYLPGINNKSDPNRQSKLKIYTQNLPPKATTNVEMIINLPALAPQGNYAINSMTLYDSISGIFILTFDILVVFRIRILLFCLIYY